MPSQDLAERLKAFLKALLMDRLEPLPNNREALHRREEAVKNLLKAFEKLPAAQTSQEDPRAKQIVDSLIRELDGLLEGQALETAERVFAKSLDSLMRGVKLDKGDTKKWPALTCEDKAVRILTNYLCENTERWVLEKPFREFNTARHWSIARQYLQTGDIPKAEEELNWAQQELRHVIAISLGIDLIQFREDAETLSQTTSRPEREVTVELFESYLKPDRQAFLNVAQALAPLLESSPIYEKMIRPIPEKPFPPREIKDLKTPEEIFESLRQQSENLTLVLAQGSQIDLRNLLREILHLPESTSHCYFRMPDINRFKNVKILNASREILIEFDEKGRLARAPSLHVLNKGEIDEPDLFDVAIIGGGPGGIAAAAGLMCLDVFRSILFERSEPNSTIRDIWSREKEADTFYSGPPDPIEGIVGMQDTTRAVFLNRMNSFIDYFHLNLHRREPVLDLRWVTGNPSVRGQESGEVKQSPGCWLLKTPKGSYKARTVIMTAGRYGKPKLLKWEEGISDPDLKNHIVRGVEVDDIQNSTVLVIGGGNTAFDNVRTLTDHGSGGKNNKVYVSYFKKPFNVPASLHVHNNEQLLQWEAEGKLTILWNTNTQAVEAVEEGGKKRFKMIFKEPEQAPLVCDYFAPAVGWQIDKAMMEKVGVIFPEGGKGPDCDPQTLQAYGKDASGERAPIPGLYITGDYYLQRSVPAALTTGFRAAKAIAHKLKK